MIKEFTRADVPGNEKILILTEYILTVQDVFENGQRKCTEIRLKTRIVHLVHETIAQVKAMIPNPP